MKRLTPAEVAEWRRKSVETYRARAKAHGVTRRKASEKPQESPQRARKREADAGYQLSRAQRLVRARGRCEYQVNPDMVTSRCAQAATDAHHVVKRSTHVDHSVENLRVLCHPHHMWIHEHPEWAKENGWIASDWQQIDRREG